MGDIPLAAQQEPGPTADSGTFISESVTAWPGRDQPSHNPLSRNTLHRASVPANLGFEFGRDGSRIGPLLLPRLLAFTLA